MWQIITLSFCVKLAFSILFLVGDIVTAGKLGNLSIHLSNFLLFPFLSK